MEKWGYGKAFGQISMHTLDISTNLENFVFPSWKPWIWNSFCFIADSVGKTYLLLQPRVKSINKFKSVETCSRSYALQCNICGNQSHKKSDFKLHKKSHVLGVASIRSRNQIIRYSMKSVTKYSIIVRRFFRK